MWLATPRTLVRWTARAVVVSASLALAADGPPDGPGGATSPAYMLRDIWPGIGGNVSMAHGDVAATGRIAYFPAADPDHGIEVWRTDGTREGTRLVQDVYAGPGETSGGPWISPHTDGATLYFVANDLFHGHQLWKTNGKGPGARMVKDVSPAWVHKVIGRVGSFTLFSTSDGIMRTDGTEAGTQPIMRDVELCDSLDFALAPDAVYFKGKQPATGCELWRTDGTADGTRMVKEVQPGPGTTPFWLAGLVYSGGLVYFQGCDPVSCLLWRSDGTEEGTFDLGVTASSVPGTSCAPFRDMLLFVRNTPEYGSELWRTDGSVAGTQLVKDIHPGPNGSLLSMNGASQGDAYVFFAIDAQHGREPWRTDGTAAGTYLLRDIQPGPSAFPWNSLLGVPGRGTFFMGNDGVHGNELWLTDGYTTAGTRPLTNLPANTGGVWPQIVTDRYLLFFVSSPVYGGEPWAYELGAIPQ